MLHRTLFYESLRPKEEQGTKVSLEDHKLEDEYINTLECVTFESKVMMKARLSYHKIDLRKLEVEEIQQIKVSLARHNFDNRFEINIT